jgi:hypothetical protein
VKTQEQDYYRLLGVRPDATMLLIKKAYRQLAKHYHPDLNPDPDAAQRFREITEAYDTLTNPGRRRRYDHLHPTHTGTGTSDGPQPGTTGPGQDDHSSQESSGDTSPAASTILKILEEIWLEIRRWHPEIPPVVIIIASGTSSKHPRWGHHAPGRWNVAGLQRGEVMISGEGLRRTAPDVLATLLHEAAHALAAARGITDTSRQGRYHNKHFKTLAGELGLITEHDSTHGWSAATLTDVTHIAYARQLTGLAQAMTIWRHGDTTTGPTTRRTSNYIPATCPCGRTIRIAASTLAEAPITCQGCDGDFQAKNATTDT